MTFDAVKYGAAILRVVFGLGPLVARPCSYVRPMGLNQATGLYAPAEIAAPCLALVGKWALPQWSPATLAAGTERLVVRASELAGVPGPGAGDLVVETSTGVVWRIVGGFLDASGLAWVFQGEARGDEYWGDLLGAIATVEDRGGLGAVTARENWLQIV